MAKVGYIFKANHYDTYEADKEWMLNFGCEQIIEEETDHEVMRPQWKQLMNALYRGDVLVVSKFSNAVRGVRELSVCIEMCRIKVVRLISIQDRIDSHNELFKETTAADVLEMVGALPEEIAALRKSSSHVMLFQKNIKSPAKTGKNLSRTERERSIVDMYNSGYSCKWIQQQKLNIPHSEQIQCRFEQRPDQRTEAQEGNGRNRVTQNSDYQVHLRYE